MGYVYAGSLSIINSKITENSADRGGALYITNYCDLILEKSVFNENTATNTSGAIYLGSNVNYIITGCTISNNTANDFGGGLYLSSNVQFDFSNCIISNNTPSSELIFCGQLKKKIPMRIWNG